MCEISFFFFFVLSLSTLKALIRPFFHLGSLFENHNAHINTLFSISVFFHEHPRFTGQQGKGEAISLTLLYHFHPLKSHLDISRAITAELTSAHSQQPGSNREPKLDNFYKLSYPSYSFLVIRCSFLNSKIKQTLHCLLLGFPVSPSISLTLLYHFHPLKSHLDISRAITAELTSAHSQQPGSNREPKLDNFYKLSYPSYSFLVIRCSFLNSKIKQTLHCLLLGFPVSPSLIFFFN